MDLDIPRTTYGARWRVAYERLADDLVILAVWTRNGDTGTNHPVLDGLSFPGEATAGAYLDRVGFAQ